MKFDDFRQNFGQFRAFERSQLTIGKVRLATAIRFCGRQFGGLRITWPPSQQRARLELAILFARMWLLPRPHAVRPQPQPIVIAESVPTPRRSQPSTSCCESDTRIDADHFINDIDHCHNYCHVCVSACHRINNHAEHCRVKSKARPSSIVWLLT